MPLPKLNVPVYEAILPSTETVIKYRPFLVKEEKILLTAMESEDEKSISAAVKQIINNCVQGKLDVEKLPTFDIEYLFLRLRAKSVGEEVTIGLKPWGCPQNNGELCEKTTEVKINLEEVKVQKHEEHNNKIMLNDDIGILMSYPNIEKLQMVMQGGQGSQTEQGLEIIKDSVSMIFTEEETHERDSFSEEELDEFFESLTTDQFTKIRQFFETMPQLKHTVKYKCATCGEEKSTEVRGLNSFFG
tara:strand:+ start:1284 stop:2018 length:735 start_codon:yes stop_codon:yes gene_type:complete